MAELLLLLQFVVFVFGFNYIFRRDRLFGLYFFFLCVYALPAEIGYYYLSELSVLLHAYFGEAVWYPSAWLVLLSLLAFVILFALFRRRFIDMAPLVLDVFLRRKPAGMAWSSVFVLVGLAGYELIYLAVNFPSISWLTAQDEDFVSSSPGMFMFMFMFKFMVAVNVTLYVVLRQNASILGPNCIRGIFAVTLPLFVVISSKLGNRTDLLALALGVAMFESYRVNFTLRKIAAAGVAVTGLFVALSAVEFLRYEGNVQELNIASALIVKDYYSPAHMLFAATEYGMVDPLEVIRSNAANVLVKLNYPYLQTTITDMFREGVATRSAGYAFYILTEGFMFAGSFGFVYNGVVLMFGLTVWRKLAMSNSESFNLFLLALMGCMMVNLVRSQSSYFIKYLYTFVGPGVLLYACLAGITVRPAIRIRWRRRRTGQFVARAVQTV